MRKKRTKYEVREGIQAALERRRRFDYAYIAAGEHWTMPDKDYRYRLRFGGRIAAGFFRTVLFAASPLFKLLYGYRVIGKSNLRALKKSGAIAVCNHFSYIDTFFVRAALGHYRSFHTMAPVNNKRGLGGWCIRHGGMLPFSTDYAACKNFRAELKRLLSRGKIVNFYAERAMWGNYQKPRPMKDGAFVYAERLQVPVLPVFCTFRKSKRGHMRRVRIHILPAVYPREGLGRRQCAAAMRAEAEAAWKACYEESYGIPLAYLPQTR